MNAPYNIPAGRCAGNSLKLQGKQKDMNRAQLLLD
jgi:hypothetical protein